MVSDVLVVLSVHCGQSVLLSVCRFVGLFIDSFVWRFICWSVGPAFDRSLTLSLGQAFGQSSLSQLESCIVGPSGSHSVPHLGLLSQSVN